MFARDERSAVVSIGGNLRTTTAHQQQFKSDGGARARGAARRRCGTKTCVTEVGGELYLLYHGSPDRRGGGSVKYLY